MTNMETKINKLKENCQFAYTKWVNSYNAKTLAMGAKEDHNYTLAFRAYFKAIEEQGKDALKAYYLQHNCNPN